METVGLRELRHDASGLVRRAQAGEEITITVAGRPSARITAVGSKQWRHFDAISELFDGLPDDEWPADRARIDETVRDPWAAA